MNEVMEQKIITVLLDKYERSSFFRTDTTPTKRILLKLYENGKCEFLDYNIENSEQRIRINECVRVLAKKGLISYAWMKGEENHILSKVWLNMENLQQAYSLTHRQPQGDFLADVDVELVECMGSVQSKWMKDFLLDASEFVKQKRKLPPLLPDNSQERKSLLQALQYIDANGSDGLLKRVFSIRCFGDSKYFERVIEARLLRILKKYLESDEYETDEQVLNQIGIAKYPEQFEFCGALSLEYPDGKCVDFVSLCGGTIYMQDITAANLRISKNVRRILSIENKANYFDYIGKHRKTDDLVIYHGGQYSPTKRLFFQAVADASMNLPWYHWGDIDYGGFSMLARLRREINVNVQPYRMSKQELITYAPFAISFASQYSAKLQSLVVNSDLSDCVECINYMLEKKIRLEQEALLE